MGDAVDRQAVLDVLARWRKHYPEEAWPEVTAKDVTDGKASLDAFAASALRHMLGCLADDVRALDRWGAVAPDGGKC